jgi:hypothetical protein
MSGFYSPRPRPNDTKNYLGIEIEGPDWDDMYPEMEQEFKRGPYSKFISSHDCEGEVSILVPQVDYKEVLQYVMRKKRKLGHYVNSKQFNKHNGFNNWDLGSSSDWSKYFHLPLHKRQYEVGPDCGLHVHVDVRHRNRNEVYDILNGDDARRELCQFRAAYRKSSDEYWGDDNASCYGGLEEDVNLEREGYDTVEVRFLDANFDFDRTCEYIKTILHLIKRVK